jgi:magnesium chelatase family protein
MDRVCRMDTATRALLVSAVKRASLSMRAALRVVKVARTVADLEASPEIRDIHVAEALQYRPEMLES